MSKKKIAYFYDADVGNYYYGQVSDHFLGVHALALLRTR